MLSMNDKAAIKWFPQAKPTINAENGKVPSPLFGHIEIMVGKCITCYGLCAGGMGTSHITSQRAKIVHINKLPRMKWSRVRDLGPFHSIRQPECDCHLFKMANMDVDALMQRWCHVRFNTLIIEPITGHISITLLGDHPRMCATHVQNSQLL